MKRLLCILNLIFGLAVVVLTSIQGYRLGVWVDENPAPNFPTAELDFLLFGVGFLIMIVSLIQLLALSKNK